MYNLKFLYIFFLVLALNLSFFSTNNLNAKAFLIDEILISEKLENNFNKDTLINKGFIKAFGELMGTLVKSKDLSKTNNVSLKEIKSMVDTFSIEEEKFINQSYNLKLGVSFNKKKIFNYLNSKNIIPSQIIKQNFLFIPIIIDETNTDPLIFSKNQVYDYWKKEKENNHLINYILPTEDLEDFNLIKKNYLELENYDFKEIIDKYFIDYSIVALIFKDGNQIKILSKIKIKDKKVIQSNTFKDIDLNNKENLKNLINKLKIIYEDFWKENNLINTSIKLSLIIQVDNRNLELSSKFEKTLEKIDLVNSFSINRFNQNYIFYEIIFNGTPKNFINIMKNENYIFNTQRKIWILE